MTILKIKKEFINIINHGSGLNNDLYVYEYFFRKYCLLSLTQEKSPLKS